MKIDNAILMSLYKALQKSNDYLIAERDALYDSITDSEGRVTGPTADREALAELDAVIDGNQLALAKARGDQTPPNVASLKNFPVVPRGEGAFSRGILFPLTLFLWAGDGDEDHKRNSNLLVCAALGDNLDYEELLDEGLVNQVPLTALLEDYINYWCGIYDVRDLRDHHSRTEYNAGIDGFIRQLEQAVEHAQALKFGPEKGRK